jgi:nitrite reductase/ring-hydroxylating ferredoxin subunit
MADEALEPVRLPAEALDLGEQAALRFRVRVHGVERDAFVVRHAGRLHAYVNSCRHQSRSLDDGGGRFFDEAAGFLVCRHHGARYDASTGRCVDGPCAGGALTALAIEARGGELWCTGLIGR